MAKDFTSKLQERDKILETEAQTSPKIKTFVKAGQEDALSQITSPNIELMPGEKKKYLFSLSVRPSLAQAIRQIAKHYRTSSNELIGRLLTAFVEQEHAKINNANKDN